MDGIDGQYELPNIEINQASLLVGIDSEFGNYIFV
jgi:hypothetical protein